MIRFEVSGSTVEEFTESATMALVLLGMLPELRGMALRVTTEPDGEPTTGSKISSPASSPKKTPVSQPSPSIVHSDPVEDLFSSETKGSPETSKREPAATSTKKSNAKGPKLDDLKARLSDIIVTNTERWDLKRANAYARKLLKEFGVEKLGDIKPERYDEFLAASAYYLIGNAGE